MDISKDISLVNSDNESSIVTANDESSIEKLQELIIVLQEQLKTKDRHAAEIQTTIDKQKQTIESLENSGKELQDVADSSKEKLTHIEGENEYLKATIFSLESVIKGQKQHIQNAQKDIESYNSTVEKLQEKLENIENILCGKIDDVQLETMIANENKVIANNQNLNNIILSFKVALETKNGEINNLKSILQKNDELDSENITLKNQLDFKGRQMSTLITEVNMLKEQKTEDIEMISRLISTEELLNNKLSNLQKLNESLQKIKQENSIRIHNLEEDNDKLSRAIAEKQVNKQETDLNEEIAQIRQELDLKNQETHDLMIIVGDLQAQVKEFSIRQNEFINRDEGHIQQIEQLSQNIEELRNVLNLKKQELSVLQAHVDKTDDDNNKLFSQNERYVQQMSILSKELETISKDLLEKNEKILELEHKLSGCMSIKSKIEDIAMEQSEVINLKEDLNEKIAHLTEELNKSQNLLYVKGQEVEEIQRLLNDVQNEYASFKSEFERLVKERDSMVLSNEKLSEQMIQLSEELAKNRLDLEIKEQDMSNLQMTLTENNKKYSDIHLQLEKCNQDNQSMLCTNEKLSLNVAQLTNELDAVQKEIQLKEQIIIDLKTELSAANGAKTALQLQIEEVNQASAEIIHRNDSLSQQIKELTEVHDKVNNDFEIKKQEFTDLLSKLNTADEVSRNNKILYLHIEKLQEANDELMRQSNNFEQDVNELNQKIYNFQEELKTRNNYINDLEIELKESEDKQSDLLINQAQLEELNDLRHDLVRQNENFKQQTMQLIEKFNSIRSELDIKNQDIVDFQSKLKEVEDNNKKLRNELLSKEDTISLLQDRITCLNTDIENLTQNQEVGITNSVNEIDSLKSEIQTKEHKIEELGHNIKDMDLKLEEQFKKSNDLQQKLEESTDCLKNILIKVFECMKNLKIDNNITNIDESDIDCMLNVVLNHLLSLIEAKDNECKESKQMLVAAKEDILELTQLNVKLTSEYLEMATKNRDLCSELEKVSNVNRDLLKTAELIEYLKAELCDKSNELTGMETKVRAWKDQITYYEDLMKNQIVDLQLEKNNLEDLHKVWQLTSVRHNSPKSLLTICCNKIVESLQLQESSTNTESNVKLHRTESKMNICDDSFPESGIELSHVKSRMEICICSELTSDLQLARRENEELKNNIKNLESSNRYLLEEREEVRKEIQQLMEPAIDLQKKITNHRTNLSTLTATTFAENKLLNSQLKVLKHYHTRYIHVCQRDIPAVKSQLHELMSILRDNSSFLDKHNSSFKRYSLPDVLDNNSMISNFKNESTLDGDLLMLDTNVTLTTNADYTLMGHDQTCLDVTQIHFDSEVACQTNDLSKVIDSCSLYSQIESLTNDNQKIIEIVEALKDENAKLKEEIDDQKTDKNFSRIDAQSSPIKCKVTCNDSITKCEKCAQEQELEKLLHHVKNLNQELQNTMIQKNDLKKKYSDLVFEMPAVDALAKKLSNTETECENKIQENARLTKDLSKKNTIISELQEENDSLSTQLMEGITEADDLKKDLDTLKNSYNNLEEKYAHLEKITTESGDNFQDNNICSQCAVKENIIKTLKNKQTIDFHSKLNRSLSDSESSSRHNKFSTLQSELHASKEDCKKITEEVATIKNHLERSNLSMSQAMDLDESMGESNIFSCIGFKSDEQHVNRFKGNIPEERPLDFYALDKIDCFNFYTDKTGVEKENVSNDLRIIDVLRMLYDNLIAKHGNEVENLLNKLRDFEETKNQLLCQIRNTTAENLRLTTSLQEKDNSVKSIANVFTQIKSNLNALHEIPNDNKTSIMSLFKDNYLEVLDTAFELSSKRIFESLIDSIVDKQQDELGYLMEKYSNLHEQMESVLVEFKGVSESLQNVKQRLSTKEDEYNLLNDQKERILEISKAVTLDIVNRDRELGEIVKNCCDKLVTLKVLSDADVNPDLNTNEKIKSLLDLLSQSVIETKSEACQVQDLKTTVEINQNKLESVKLELAEKERNLRSQATLYEQLTILYQQTLKRHNDEMGSLITKTNVLKDTISKKEELIQILDCKLSSNLEESFSESINELKQKIQSLEQENATLKSFNQMITKQKEVLTLELEKSAEIIKKNKVDIDKMTADVLALRESVADNMKIVESLTLESKSLLENNIQLKKQYEEKGHECSRLAINIKIFENTAALQNKTILK